VATIVLGRPSLGAAETGPETTGFHFLSLGAGPRIEGLAGAGTAVSEGADALTFNPALMAGSGGRQVAGSYFNWLEGVRSGYLGAVQAWGRGALGLSVRSLSVSEFGNVVGEPEIGQSDVAVALGAARPLFFGLDAGLALKGLRSSLAEQSATGWALDAGLNYRYVEGWNLAAALRNWGPAIGYVDGVDEQLPTQAAFGLGATFGELRVDSEVVWENGPGSHGAVGLEYWFRNRLALRAGSRLGTDSDDAMKPWAAGFGIRARRGLLVDYSYRDGTFDPSHRVGIRWNFGRDDTGRDQELALSPRKFYRGALDKALDQAMVNFPTDLEDTVVVRATATHDAGPVIASIVVERLREWGLNADARDPEPQMSEEDKQRADAALAEAGLPPLDSLPALEFEIVKSDYRILRSKRARFVGPRSIDRSAEVHLAFTLSSAGETLWTSEGRSEVVEETVNASRIPPSPGYPQASGTGSEGTQLHPLVEPAIVVGIVTGLAVIFFTNRDVAE
jgi:hypothetical protein